MTTTRFRLVIAGVTFAAFTVQAGFGPFIPESQAHGLYGKVEVGAGYNNDLKDSWDDGSLSNRDTDNSDTVYRVVAGYQINPYVSVEGSYHDLGEYSLSGVSDGSGDSWDAGSISGTQEAEGWSLSITGRWPLSERWTLYGTFGWMWWESDETYNENGFVTHSNESGSDLTFSGGLEYDIGLKDRIVLTTGIGDDRVGDDNLDVISGFAGALYRLP